MLRNYFLSCLRHLRRHKTFTAINVLGLSIGMSAAIVIFMIVFFESGFDRGVKDYNRVYRVVIDANFGGMEGHNASIPGPAAVEIPREIPGVEQVIPAFYFPFDGAPKVSITSLNGQPDRVIKKQNGVIFTTRAYTDALQLKWLAGSPDHALSVPYQVVLTASRAESYFPGVPFGSIPGRRLKYNEDFSATVTGVVADPGPQFSMTADDLVSFSTATETALGEQFMIDNWDDWMAYSQLYIKLGKDRNPAEVQASLRALVKRRTKPVAPGQGSYTLTLQPLNDVHFNRIYSGYNGRLADSKTMTGLMLIGGFLLFLGSVNFINLTTADAARRAREIGVRKTLGSSQKQLVWLFLGETFSITTLAGLISLVMVPVLFRLFAGFLPPGLHFDPLRQPALWIFLISLIIAVTFLSGLYPAFILSGFRPVSVLKNQVTGGGETRFAWIRKGLTVSQFVVAQFFLIATVAVAKQLQYGLNMDMGFSKTAILSLDVPRERGDSAGMHQQTLMNKLAAMPEIKTATFGGIPPAGPGMSITNISYAPKKDLKANVQIRFGQPSYLDVFGIKLVAGRNVQASDTAREFLINETYASLLGFASPQQAIGQVLDWNGNSRLPIVGVIHDFHASGTRAAIGPLVFTQGGGGSVHVLLQGNRTPGGGWKNAIAKMQAAYAAIYPESDFMYHFYDQQIASMYEQDEKLAGLLTWATALTILISCLGLLGLVIYTTRTRTKEISIRKVLGASVGSIVGILSSGFLRLIVIAFLVAAPLAWWATNAWLEQFAFRIPLSWWIFAMSGGGLLLAAVITLSLQTIRAARANPVTSLKAE